MTGESARLLPATPNPRGSGASGVLLLALRGATALLAVGAVLMIGRLPWIGDLGVHAATVERLRHDLFHPGNPMVDSPTDSPYYSPWTVTLGLFAKATGLGTFDVLRCAGAVGLLLLATGVRRFVRTLTRHPAAPPLALLCLLLLWGARPIIWSGFAGLMSLSANLSYPSTFATGLGFHFLALLTHALRRPGTSVAAYAGLGALWAVLTLSHQFTGVVFTFGAAGVLVAARVPARRAAVLRLGAALLTGLALLAAWPYYSFFELLGVGGLEEIHRPLYRHLGSLFTFVVPLGALALALRWRRDHRDPLVVWCALGLATVVAGGLLGKWSLGRTEPAVLMPAQIAVALCVLEAGGRRFRTGAGVVLAAALAVGVWAQRHAVTFVVPADRLPAAVTRHGWPLWKPVGWAMRDAAYGDVFLTGDRRAAVTLPAYGGYTVAPGYPDFFLPDERRRVADTERYFAPGTPRAERLAVLRRYHVRWVLQRPSRGGLPAGDPALREAGTGPDGRVLYEVTGAG
ncbi:hypothetical protein [Streptomyces sp. NPDC004267]|uniref:hypothetical protein n=1 Tax=Streptomyces sp. NPDC004267 TaxID=3364694 RepID=UPI0036A4839D